MAHSDCGWTCGCAGKSVRFLENTCRTWALLRWWFTTKRRYIIIVVITVNKCSAFFCKKNPKRASSAIIVEREEKDFEVALKRWKRKTIVSEVSRKWVSIWRAGVCKWTSSVRSKFHTWEVEMTTISRSQVATTRHAGDGLAAGLQVFRSHLVQTSEHLDADSEPNPVDNVQPV